MNTFEIIQKNGKTAQFLINGQDISNILLSYDVQTHGSGRAIITLRLLGNLTMKVTGPESTNDK